MKMGRRSVLAGVALAGGLLLAGCGTPGAPMPPSLNLPQPVADLAAVRSGDQVSLTWSMPKKNTDKLFLKDNVAVRVCRGSCNATNAELSFAPGADGTYTDTLPASFNAGAPRPLSYFVELKNRSGRSAGLSNAAVVLAGAAPAPVAGLTAEVRKAGVILHYEDKKVIDYLRAADALEYCYEGLQSRVEFLKEMITLYETLPVYKRG